MSSLQPSPTIILPQLPPKTFVGIDLITFTSTANFHGITDLPSGWHFLYTGTTESLSLRCGAWFYVGDLRAAGDGHSETALALSHGSSPAPDIFVWKWDPETESLAPLDGTGQQDSQDMMRFKANLGAIVQSGGLFRYRGRVSPAALTKQSSTGNDVMQVDDPETEESGRRDWRGLTDSVSPALLSRIVGTPDVDMDGHPRWPVTSASTANCDADDIPGLERQSDVSSNAPRANAREERNLNFNPVDLKRTWREGAVGRERTEAAQDRSWALGDFIRRYSGDLTTLDERIGERHMLGELQFTFLMALTMMNFSCLQQWKRLLGLILTCRQAIKDRESFMTDVLRLLLCQLQRCDVVEGGLFEIDGDEGGRFLRELLTKLRRSVDEIVGNGISPVKSELDKLGKWVKEEYDWDLQREFILRRGMIQLEDGEEIEMEMDDNDEDEETGEYAPLVVDT